MILGIQVVAILFAITMAYLTYTHYKRHEFNIQEIIWWMALWAGFIFVTIFPHSVNFLVRTFKLNRALDLVIIIGFLVLFAIAFRNSVQIDKLEEKIERLVRSEALRDVKKE